jgi:uncharacterized protein (DUF2062 family)
MIHFTRALVRKWLDRLLHIDDTPERTAGAYAMGVFIGFSPFLGLHTILGVLFAFVFNVNRVAVLLGVYSNLPWIIAAYYASVTMAGAALMRYRVPPDFNERLTELFGHSLFESGFWHQLGALIYPLLLPFAIGSLIGAAILGAIAYPLALGFVNSRRRLRGIIHKRH